MFCLLIGSMAVMSVRRQKRATSSLFDQRKQAAKQKNKGKKGSDFSNEEEEVEFTRVDLERLDLEMVPLVESSSNPLEVI
jgi:hypothetical protein